MAQRGLVEVIDKGGWRKNFPLTKSIVHIGSDARNDIVVEAWHGTGLAARHLQMVPSPSSGLGYRLVNMGTLEAQLGPNGERALAPRAAIDLTEGDILRLGELTFVFHGADDGSRAQSLAPAIAIAAMARQPEAASAGAAPSAPLVATAAVAAPGTAGAQRGNPIGLSLTLSQTRLIPAQPIDGVITVKNQGDRTSVQFKIEVDGFAPESYDLGPAPILFPNVEKQITFRLRHPQKPVPPAGDQRLTIRVSAPGSYPGEVATASEVIQVVPYLKHSLSLEMPR